MATPHHRHCKCHLCRPDLYEQGELTIDRGNGPVTRPIHWQKGTNPVAMWEAAEEAKRAPHQRGCVCQLCDATQTYDPPWLKAPEVQWANSDTNPVTYDDFAKQKERARKEEVFSAMYGRRWGKNRIMGDTIMAALDKMMRDMEAKGLTFNVNEAKKRIEVQPGGLGKFLKTLRENGVTPIERTIRGPIIGIDPGNPSYAALFGYAVVEKDPYEVDEGVKKLIDEFRDYTWPEWAKRKQDRNHWKRDLYGEWPAEEPVEKTLPAYSEADAKATMRMCYNFNLPTTAHLPGGSHNPYPWAEGDTFTATVQFEPADAGEGEQEMDRREVLAQQLKALQEEQAVLDRFPRVDNYPEGTVLRFNKVFGGSWEDLNAGDVDAKVYYFAAIKCEGVWYLSGNHTNQGKFMRWGKLVEWLADSVKEVWLMTPDVDILSGNRPDTIDGETVEDHSRDVPAAGDQHEAASALKPEGWTDEATGLKSGGLVTEDRQA